MDHLHESDAAYVLGALSIDDRRAFEEHLAHCDQCAASVRDLAGLPGLLATVPRAVAEAEPVPPLPDTLLPALVVRVRQERARRRWTAGLVAAGAALIVSAGGIAIAMRQGDVPPAPPNAVSTSTPSPTATRPDAPMTPLVASPVQARLALTGVAWGTRLELTCSYADAGDYHATSPAAYVLVVHGRDGGSEEVASWRALPGRTMRLTGASAYSLGDIASVEIRTPAGVAVLGLRT